jgi:hypothetical protein
MKRSFVFVYTLAVLAVPVFGQVRAFDTIFPNLDAATKTAIFSSYGFVQAINSSRYLPVLSQSSLDTSIAEPVLRHNFKLMAESIAVIEKQTDFIHLYNALGNISGLNGRVYQKPPHSGNYFYLFDGITRIPSAADLTPLADPPPAALSPPQDTFYIRLKDSTFGYSYYRVDMVTNARSMVYTVTNCRALFLYFVPVMREGDFIARLYLEPIEEGFLAYSVAGIEVPDFAVSLMNIAQAVENRMEALIQWIVEGL